MMNVNTLNEKRRRAIVFLSGAALAAGVCGCNADGRVSVGGTVTCDGEPIRLGSISFMPVSGQGVPGGSMIMNGRYSLRMFPGDMAVQIDAFEEVRKANPTQEETERGLDVDRVSIIPARYNRESELRASINGPTSDLHFVVTSK